MAPPPHRRPRAFSAHRLLLAGCVVFGTACAARAHRPPAPEPLLAPYEGPRTLAVAAVAGGGEGLIPPPRRATIAAVRTEVVQTSVGLLDRRVPVVAGRRHRADCSGFVQAVYAGIGIDLYEDGGAPGEGGVAILHRWVAERGGLHGRRPLPGDLVFFDDTYARSGRRGNRLTHVGIVERVEADGTVVFVHHMQGRVRRGRLNREAPDVVDDPETGRRLNDYLRREDGTGPTLAGQLFAGYGTVVR